MKNMWNLRYSQEEYVYGKKANEFFMEEIQKLKPGKILLPGEGEGRNAVCAAKLGWDVVAFDSSVEGKKKAEKLALKNNVNIDYRLLSYEEISFEDNSFDLVSLIFTHSMLRNSLHENLTRILKPGGLIILEGFSKKQIDKNTGGPQNIDLLFSREELDADFHELSDVQIMEKDIILDEGIHHKGEASIIRLIGKK